MDYQTGNRSLALLFISKNFSILSGNQNDFGYVKVSQNLSLDLKIQSLSREFCM